MEKDDETPGPLILLIQCIFKVVINKRQSSYFCKHPFWLQHLRINTEHVSMGRFVLASEM